MEIAKIKEGSDPSKDTIIEAVNTNADAIKEIVEILDDVIDAVNKLNNNRLFE